MYCYAVAPAWCTMYWVDPARIPAWGAVVIFCAYPAVFAAGFLLVRAIRGIGRRMMLVAVPLLAILGLAVFFPHRLFAVGTMQDWALGATVPLWLVAHVGPVAIGGPLVALAVFLYLLLRFGAADDHRWERCESGSVSVSFVRSDGDLGRALRESLEAWDGLAHLQRRMREKGEVVLLKPNIGGGSYRRAGTSTSPEFIAAAVRTIRDVAPEARLVLLESDMIFWRISPYVAKTAYHDMVEAERLEFLNLSHSEQTSFDFGGRLGKRSVPKILLDGAVLVDLPVPKTHAFFTFSGAIKNLFGLLPRQNKLLHYHARRMGDAGGEIFLDLYRCFPPDLVLVDGTVSGEGHCPLGTGKRTDFIATSPDALAVDVALCRIMGIDPVRVPYLRKLCRAGAVPSLDFPALGPEEVKPKTPWKQTNPLVGLAVNVWRILYDRALLRRKRAGD